MTNKSREAEMDCESLYIKLTLPFLGYVLPVAIQNFSKCHAKGWKFCSFIPFCHLENYQEDIFCTFMNKKIVLPNLVSDRIALLGSYKTLCSIVFKQLMNLTFFCMDRIYRLSIWFLLFPSDSYVNYKRDATESY